MYIIYAQSNFAFTKEKKIALRYKVDDKTFNTVTFLADDESQVLDYIHQAISLCKADMPIQVIVEGDNETRDNYAASTLTKFNRKNITFI